jgi:CBS-domain-containing membrane protein
MPVNYKLITIFASEDSRWDGKPLSEAVVKHVKDLKTVARCMVFRGASGCYENGEIATPNILEFSYNMPVKIEILIPEAEADSVLNSLKIMVADGVVTINDVKVCSFKSSKRLIPGHLKVKDVMTLAPQAAAPDTPVNEVINWLLTSPFNGVPVIDAKGRVAGMITQNDLIQKAKLPIRVGLLARLGPDDRKNFLDSHLPLKAEEIMTRPAIVINEEQHLNAAVQLMLKHRLKRLPVVNSQGGLTGLLSRVDIFKTIAQQSSKWSVLAGRNIEVTGSSLVKDIMDREMHIVRPDAPVAEVIEMICSEAVQRVAVVDCDGRLLGLISDCDILPLIVSLHLSVWDLFVSKLTFAEAGRKSKGLLEHSKAKTAAALMKQDLITIQEDAPVDAAIQLMTQKGLKRLPVIDSNGIFKGMISRDELLRSAVRQR